MSKIIRTQTRNPRRRQSLKQLINSDIKNFPSVIDHYPGTEMLELDCALIYLPDTFHTMLDCLFVGKDRHRNVAGIGQAIIQAVRPWVNVVRLQIGLAIQTHHLYHLSSRDSVSNRIFLISLRCSQEKNVANVIAEDIHGDDVDSNDLAVLFAGDNIDHTFSLLTAKAHSMEWE